MLLLALMRVCDCHPLPLQFHQILPFLLLLPLCPLRPFPWVMAWPGKLSNVAGDSRRELKNGSNNSLKFIFILLLMVRDAQDFKKNFFLLAEITLPKLVHIFIFMLLWPSLSPQFYFSWVGHHQRHHHFSWD